MRMMPRADAPAGRHGRSASRARHPKLAPSYSFTPHSWRLATGKAELRQHLQRAASKPYAARLADFHLLLYLAQQPGLEAASDLAGLVGAVHAGGAVPEGFQLIIDSLAEL